MYSCRIKLRKLLCGRGGGWCGFKGVSPDMDHCYSPAMYHIYSAAMDHSYRQAMDHIYSPVIDHFYSPAMDHMNLVSGLAAPTLYIYLSNPP